MSHIHQTQKTHIVLIEFDDVIPDRLVADIKYFGEGNSKNRKLEFDFEYCLECSHRLLDGNPIITNGILDELEKYVVQSKRGDHQSRAEATVQHSDFEILERIIKSSIKLGELRQKQFNL